MNDDIAIYSEQDAIEAAGEIRTYLGRTLKNMDIEVDYDDKSSDHAAYSVWNIHVMGTLDGTTSLVRVPLDWWRVDRGYLGGREDHLKAIAQHLVYLASRHYFFQKGDKDD
jgi:hypothetical protein